MATTVQAHSCSDLSHFIHFMHKACKFLHHCRTSYMSSSHYAELSWIILGPTANARKAPPLPQNPETPNACINLVHPGGKNPAAANVVPPSKLCPRSSTNSKVMWMPPPLSSYFVCLPQLWGKERKWDSKQQKKTENARPSKVAQPHRAPWLSSETLPRATDLRAQITGVWQGMYFWMREDRGGPVLSCEFSPYSVIEYFITGAQTSTRHS